MLRLLKWRTVNTHEQVSCPLPSRLRNLPIPNLLGYVCMDGYLDGCLTSYPVHCTYRYIIRPFHSSKQQPPPLRTSTSLFSLSLSPSLLREESQAWFSRRQNFARNRQGSRNFGTGMTLMFDCPGRLHASSVMWRYERIRSFSAPLSSSVFHRGFL